MNDLPYIDWTTMSDVGLEKTIGNYVKHHRLEQNITQSSLSVNAGISRSTLSLLERGESVTLGTFIKVIRALGLLHVMDTFRIQNNISPIKLAELERDKRQRASRIRD